ncbi:general secretion pathway protein GspB [Alkalimarinus alittae]|uniref:General secretion pathway protein GspB n=1 Tax=Alkalimarinus alittae TaxID=2961619 RepID=A0ABY6N6R0_9ALTE|nr:general secretion pathway protein GspB [Alkalimarinus alittae]UZE97820.1 general secretion pathway protein GspB [Alkalimarinus alittae]
MSYILDALKKSEEERHQGQLPNLGSNSTLIHMPKSKSSLWLWVIGALLVLNVCFVGFWVLTEKPVAKTPVEDSVSADVVGAIDHSDELDSTNSATNTSIESKTVANVNSNAVVIASNVQPLVHGSVSGVPHQQALTEQEMQPEPFRVQQQPSVVYTAVESPEVITPSSGYQRYRTEQERGVPQERVQEAPTIITPKGKSRPYTGPAYTAVVDETADENTAVNRHANAGQDTGGYTDKRPIVDLSSVPRVSEKPHEFQIKIPDMAFNSHIYTDTPSARRVMINNIYLREGQTFSGMKVEKIIEDGIILSIDGDPFKMGVLRDWYSPR